jgi:hypothetical protein
MNAESAAIASSSCSPSACKITEGLETSLKNALYEKCPKYRTDLRANILITILVQGCYHAYEQYSTIDQDRVVSIISKIADEISNECK